AAALDDDNAHRGLSAMLFTYASATTPTYASARTPHHCGAQHKIEPGRPALSSTTALVAAGAPCCSRTRHQADRRARQHQAGGPDRRRQRLSRPERHALRVRRFPPTAGHEKYRPAATLVDDNVHRGLSAMLFACASARTPTYVCGSSR